MGAIDPETDREILIALDSKVDKLCESIERLAISLEKLETKKVNDLNIRLTKLEKWRNEWGGAYIILAIAALVMSLGVAVKTFLK